RHAHGPHQPASAYTQDPVDTNDVNIELIIIGQDLYVSLPEELGLDAPTLWLSSTLDATDPIFQMLVEVVATLDRDSYFGAVNEQYVPYTRVEESRSITEDGGDATQTELVFDFTAMAEDLGLDAESAPMDEVRYVIVTDASSRLLSVTSDIGGLGQLVAHYSDYGTPVGVTPPPVGAFTFDRPVRVTLTSAESSRGRRRPDLARSECARMIGSCQRPPVAHPPGCAEGFRVMRTARAGERRTPRHAAADAPAPAQGRFSCRGLAGTVYTR
ncbi:MAG: hypothetical protein ACRDVZ_05485, partial [Jiangellaceae bacterium]